MIYYIVFGILIIRFLLTCYCNNAMIDEKKKRNLKVMTYILLAIDFIFILFF